MAGVIGCDGRRRAAGGRRGAGRPAGAAPSAPPTRSAVALCLCCLAILVLHPGGDGGLARSWRGGGRSGLLRLDAGDAAGGRRRPARARRRTRAGHHHDRPGAADGHGGARRHVQPARYPRSWRCWCRALLRLGSALAGRGPDNGHLRGLARTRGRSRRQSDTRWPRKRPGRRAAGAGTSAHGCPFSSSMTSSSQTRGAPTSTPMSSAVCSSAATAPIVVWLPPMRIPSCRSRIRMTSGLVDVEVRRLLLAEGDVVDRQSQRQTVFQHQALDHQHGPAERQA